MNIPFSYAGCFRGARRGPLTWLGESHLYGETFARRPFGHGLFGHGPFGGVSFAGGPSVPADESGGGPVPPEFSDDRPPSPPRRGPGPHGFGGFGPGGFGGFGPGSWGWGGPGEVGRGGRRGHRGRGRGRGGRGGNVRAAILALLVEEPRHGYAIMTELAERSGGLWRPSPGSVYPVLQQLQDEGLVSVEEADGRRVFSLTDAGRSYVAEHADEVHEPWSVADSGPVARVRSIMFALHALGAAVHEVARTADDAQAEQAVAALDQARRTLYRILADEAE
jgi:DNA-binding PadR family transcriptional regulator